MDAQQLLSDLYAEATRPSMNAMNVASRDQSKFHGSIHEVQKGWMYVKLDVSYAPKQGKWLIARNCADKEDGSSARLIVL